MEFRTIKEFPGVIVGLSGSSDAIGHLELNRPKKGNAFDAALWQAFPEAVRELQRQDSVRVVVLSARGRQFCTGIDVAYVAGLARGGEEAAGGCPARARMQLMQRVQDMQAAFTALEELAVPVIAAIHGACIGAGVDMVTACDLRLCTRSTSFCVKEVDLAITADLGTLQRLHHIVGHGVASELALTARSVSGEEALRLGLVSACVADNAALATAVADVAKQIASKPPLAVMGTKRVLRHARDHTVEEGLRHVALWNAAALLSADLRDTLALLAKPAARL